MVLYNYRFTIGKQGLVSKDKSKKLSEDHMKKNAITQKSMRIENSFRATCNNPKISRENFNFVIAF